MSIERRIMVAVAWADIIILNAIRAILAIVVISVLGITIYMLIHERNK